MNHYISLTKRKVKIALCLLTTGDLRTLYAGFRRNLKIIMLCIKAIPYIVFANIEDRRTGGKCTNKTIISKYRDQGAHALENSDYRCLDQLFKAVPLRAEDVFVDVGCGEARVLTYHDRHGFRGRLIGVEMDEEIASRAAKRVKHCENAEIINKNILDCTDVIRDGTAFFLFNPFDWKVLKPFVEMVEKYCQNSVRLYYFCDCARVFFDCREGWNILWRGKVTRPPWRDLPATIYEYKAGTIADQ